MNGNQPPTPPAGEDRLLGAFLVAWTEWSDDSDDEDDGAPSSGGSTLADDPDAMETSIFQSSILSTPPNASALVETLREAVWLDRGQSPQEGTNLHSISFLASLDSITFGLYDAACRLGWNANLGPIYLRRVKALKGFLDACIASGILTGRVVAAADSDGSSDIVYSFATDDIRQMLAAYYWFPSLLRGNPAQRVPELLVREPPGSSPILWETLGALFAKQVEPPSASIDSTDEELVAAVHAGDAVLMALRKCDERAVLLTVEGLLSTLPALTQGTMGHFEPLRGHVDWAVKRSLITLLIQPTLNCSNLRASYPHLFNAVLRTRLCLGILLWMPLDILHHVFSDASIVVQRSRVVCVFRGMPASSAAEPLPASLLLRMSVILSSRRLCLTLHSPETLPLYKCSKRRSLLLGMQAFPALSVSLFQCLMSSALTHTPAYPTPTPTTDITAACDSGSLSLAHLGLVLQGDNWCSSANDALVADIINGAPSRVLDSDMSLMSGDSGLNADSFNILTNLSASATTTALRPGARAPESMSTVSVPTGSSPTGMAKSTQVTPIGPNNLPRPSTFCGPGRAARQSSLLTVKRSASLLPSPATYPVGALRALQQPELRNRFLSPSGSASTTKAAIALCSSESASASTLSTLFGAGPPFTGLGSGPIVVYQVRANINPSTDASSSPLHTSSPPLRTAPPRLAATSVVGVLETSELVVPPYSSSPPKTAAFDGIPCLKRSGWGDINRPCWTPARMVCNRTLCDRAVVLGLSKDKRHEILIVDATGEVLWVYKWPSLKVPVSMCVGPVRVAETGSREVSLAFLLPASSSVESKVYVLCLRLDSSGIPIRVSEETGDSPVVKEYHITCPLSSASCIATDGDVLAIGVQCADAEGVVGCIVILEPPPPECVAAPPPILLHWRGPRRPRITDMLFLPSPSSSAGRQLAVADSGNECLLFYDVSGGVATVTQVLPVDPGPVPPPLNPERIGLSLISGGDAGALRLTVAHTSAGVVTIWELLPLPRIVARCGPAFEMAATEADRVEFKQYDRPLAALSLVGKGDRPVLCVAADGFVILRHYDWPPEGFTYKDDPPLLPEFQWFETSSLALFDIDDDV